MMNKHTHEPINFGNPLINLVGNVSCENKPSDKSIVKELVRSMAEFSGTCWAPVESVKDGKSTSWTLMLNQCPSGCGRVWSLVLQDEDVKNWLVNEINKTKHDKQNTNSRVD